MKDGCQVKGFIRFHDRRVLMLFYQLVPKYKLKTQSMHLYEVQGTIINSSLKQKCSQTKIIRKEYICTSSKVIYSCQIISDDTIELCQYDLSTGDKSIISVGVKYGRIQNIFVLDRRLIVVKEGKWIGWVRIDHILKMCKYNTTFLEEQHFDFRTILEAQSGLISSLSVALVQNMFVAIFLADQNICFRQLTPRAKHTLKMSVQNFSYPSDYVFTKLKVINCDDPTYFAHSKSIFLLLGIQNENGQGRYLMIQTMWKTRQFITFQILIHNGGKDVETMESFVTFVGGKYMVISIGQQIILWEREQLGWISVCVLNVEYSIKDMVGLSRNIENDDNFIIICCQIDGKKVFYRYSINKLVYELEFNPVTINIDQPISQNIIGFVKVSEKCIILVTEQKIFVLSNVIFRITEILLDFHDQNPHIDQSMVRLMPYDQFLQVVSNDSKIRDKIRQFISHQRLQIAVEKFEKNLYSSIPYLQKQNSYIIDILLKQYTLVWIYLCHLANFIKKQGQIRQFKYLFNSKNMIHQVNLVNSMFDLNVKIVQDPSMWELFGKHLKSMRDNLLTLLYFREFYVKIQKSQILHFLTDQTYLMNYATFMLYYSLKNKNKSSSQKYKNFLSQILQQRKDYPPLMALLCFNQSTYTINKYHLARCQYLIKKEQLYMQNDLQSLLSFRKSADSGTAEEYLQKIGYKCLNSFIYSQNPRDKFNDKLMVLAIPEKYRTEVEQKWQNQLVEIKGSLYLQLTQAKITEVLTEYQIPSIQTFSIQCSNPMFQFSQKLEILGKIFIKQLQNTFQSRQQIRKYNLSISYDLRQFSDHQFEQYKCSFQHQNDKMIKEHLISTEMNFLQSYFDRLLSFLDQYHLTTIINLFSKEKQQEEARQNSIALTLEQLKISRIDSHQTYSFDQNPEEKRQFVYLDILFRHLWNVYDSMSEIKECEVNEFITNKQFTQNFMKIVFRIAQLLFLEQNKEIMIKKPKTGELYLKNKIQKYLRQGRKIKIKKKSIANIDTTKWINILRTFLLHEHTQKHKQWIFDVEDLILQISISKQQLNEQTTFLLNFLFQVTII